MFVPLYCTVTFSFFENLRKTSEFLLPMTRLSFSQTSAEETFVATLFADFVND